MSASNMEDIGIVTEVNGSRIKVDIAKGGGCKNCGMKGLCGSTNTPIVLHFDTDGSYQVGDKVLVSVSAGLRVLSALLVFVFPLLALFGFFLIARRFTSEPLSVLAGFTGLILAFFVVRLVDKRVGKRINYQLGGKCENLPE
jgi:positive regulator of sigma E activity